MGNKETSMAYGNAVEVKWEVQIQTVLQGVTLRVCPESLSVLSVEEGML